MHPTDKAARVAGAVYLSMVFTAPFSLIYVPNKLIVRGDATATAANILAHETLFRLSIFGDLVGQVIFICLAIALYRLLSNVNRTWALLMVGFVLVSAAVGFLNTLNNIAGLILFQGGEFLSVFDTAQRNALGMLFIRLHSQGIFIAEIFWGVWLFPFGLLVFRSGFLPRFIGVWLMINCFGYVALSIIALFFPSYYSAAFGYLQPVLFGELAIMLWLLIKGAKVPPLRARHSPDKDGMNMIDNSQRTLAKIAGVTGLLAVAIVVFGNYVLLSPLIVPRDAAETARNIMAHQTQARNGAHLLTAVQRKSSLSCSGLYVILKPVDRNIAWIGALFRLGIRGVMAPCATNCLSSCDCLEPHPTFRYSNQTIASLGQAADRGKFRRLYVGFAIFRLGRDHLPYLWFKSGYIPKTLAAFGVISSAWCVICAFIFLVFPNFNKVVNDYWFDSPMAVFELR